MLPAREDPIVIVPYDPAWPARFEALRAELVAALPSLFVTIEHFGSTSVPGLTAKPVIDIIAAVESLTEIEAAAPALAALGYAYVSAYNDVMPERRYFRRPESGTRLAHLHVYDIAGFFDRPERRFRDHLRARPDDAASYAALKENLALLHRNDRRAYTAAKAEFISSILTTQPTTEYMCAGTPTLHNTLR